MQWKSIRVTIEGVDPQKTVDSLCYRALAEIREILRDDSLGDKGCFQRIEKIITVYEKLGSGAGTRHDFG